jgi:hypothetical protein
VACLQFPKGNEIYINCSDSQEFIAVETENRTYDYEKDAIVNQQEGKHTSGGDSSLSWDFIKVSDIFKSFFKNVKNTIIIVAIIVSIIVSIIEIIIVIIIIHCVCKHKREVIIPAFTTKDPQGHEI